MGRDTIGAGVDAKGFWSEVNFARLEFDCLAKPKGHNGPAMREFNGLSIDFVERLTW